MIYLLDIVAWVAVGILTFSAKVPSTRPVFLGVLVVGVFVAAQGLAGIIGTRGFAAFVMVLPAGIILALAGLVGIRSTSPAAPGVPGRSDSQGFGFGCLIYVVPYLVWFAAGALLAGNVFAVLLVCAVSLTIVVIGLVARRGNRERRERTN